MVEFAHWSMPVQYASVVAEHHHTRHAVGLFDVSHMGRLFFKGSAAGQFLDSISTRSIANVDAGKIRYSLICNDDGGILDDVLIYRLGTGDGFDAQTFGGDSFYMMVCNASNRGKIVDWISQQSLAQGLAIEVDDRTESTAMIAVQGPSANGIVSEIASIDPASLAYYGGAVCTVEGSPAIISRTGYTGEDGCEIITNASTAMGIWEKLHAAATAVAGGATGLAARDTLRLEAAMPLYGHELDETINAAQTNLRFAINLKNRSFVGRDAIETALNGPGLKVRVGIELAGRRPARQGCPIVIDDATVGHLTSGTLSPTLGVPIAMGYLASQHASAGTDLYVDIRGKLVAAKVVALPFYQRA